jgi:G:T-mismatch repair DNA endonuclease (very short patch repair protein)
MERKVAWKRHARIAAAQKATGVLGRAYNHLEAKLAKLMDEAGIDYQWQFRLGRYVFDFLLPNRILVEIQGTYWHADPRFHSRSHLTPTQRRNAERDAAKARHAGLCGYRLKLVWESDLRSGRVTATELLK